MKEIVAIITLVLLTGCIHGGRDLTGGGVTAYTGRTGVFDSGNTSYQHQFCEGGTQYEGDKPGLFVCAGGEIVYQYANVTSASIMSQILSLGTPAAIAYAGHEVGKGISKSGSTTNVNQEGGGAIAGAAASNENYNAAAASGGAGGNGYGYGGSVTQPMPMRGGHRD